MNRFSTAARRICLAVLASVALPSLLVFQIPAPAQSASRDLLAQAEQVLRQMSEITGLPVKAPLKKQLISRPEVEKRLRMNLHAEMTPRELHIQEATLKAFGLVSRDFNLEHFLLKFYTEQAAGFYDPRQKVMFIADWPAPDMQKMVLAHELTHALQDQNFGLEKFLRAARKNEDATNARLAVVEGYATAAMMQQLVAPMELGEMPALELILGQVIDQQFEEFPVFSKAPFFFRFQALFPYVEGMGFMQRGLSRGGWKLLGELFREPPVTTKEIFEPDFYFEKKPLPEIPLPRPEALSRIPGLDLLTENTLGQMGYYAILGQFLSEDEAKSVSHGWMADRYILYESSSAASASSSSPVVSRYVLVARTRWTNPEAALAFFHDYHSILTCKYPELTADKRSTADLFIGTAAKSQVLMLRRGEECLWAEGVPASPFDAVLAYLRSL
jgi:hypothetical protein